MMMVIIIIMIIIIIIINIFFFVYTFFADISRSISFIVIMITIFIRVYYHSPSLSSFLPLSLSVLCPLSSVLFCFEITFFVGARACV